MTRMPMTQSIGIVCCDAWDADAAGLPRGMCIHGTEQLKRTEIYNEPDKLAHWRVGDYDGPSLN